MQEWKTIQHVIAFNRVKNNIRTTPTLTTVIMNYSSAVPSWEIESGGDRRVSYNNIDLLLQLEQSMEFHDGNDDGEDDWSQHDDTNDNGNNNTNRKTTKSLTLTEMVSAEQILWKRRFQYLTGICAILTAAVLVINCALAEALTPDDDDNERSTATLSSIPILLNGIQICVLSLLYYSFCIYDHHVQQTNVGILQRSAKAIEFVSQMFPENLRRQLFNNDASTIKTSSHKSSSIAWDKAEPIQARNAKESILDLENGITEQTTCTLTNSTCSDVTTTTNTTGSNGTISIESDYVPIAEYYPETTVMLADLAGFTAWSSVHEPSEVFMLLEIIFYEFDMIATRRSIFKVETVGDCYVAVAGVPDPRPDHAVAMARFARECMIRFQSIVQQLEPRFGPGTSDLGMRIGLHSGPITGGILRGERSRFQLFGDTINTAARMESNSSKGKIQLSETTAQLLVYAKKQHWLIKREDEIEAKGKGMLQTFWLDINAHHGSMIGSATIGQVELPTTAM